MGSNPNDLLIFGLILRVLYTPRLTWALDMGAKEEEKRAFFLYFVLPVPLHVCLLWNTAVPLEVIQDM